MAVTPYVDLTTEDILSAHISGLSHSVKKIEEVLNMKTASGTFTLLPVTDQADVSLRYRIYEGQNRNWLSFTLRRNGVIVPAEEYISQPAFGVIVFHAPQLQTDSITVTATYTIAGSTRIDTIEGDVAQLEQDLSGIPAQVSTNTTDISTLKTDVSDLQGLETTVSGLQTTVSGHDSEISTLQTNQSGLTTRVRDLEDDVAALQAGGGSGGGTISSGGYGQKFPLSPAKFNWTNIMPEYSLSDLVASSSILMAGGKIDCFPIFVETRTKFSYMEVDINGASVAGNMILGIYQNLNAAPGELIASTGVFAATVGVSNKKALTTPATLDVGVYWIARWQDTGMRVNGHKWDPTKHILIEQPSSSTYMDGTGDVVGVRSGVLSGLTDLPANFPGISTTVGEPKYLAREDLGTINARTW